ncbi:MAG: 16S rRNA (guanine(966)-N(2))-methyltransferase RsmD [Bacillota bacterium]
MRIIAGEYRGRKLESFEGMDIRPTSDRVKESLFNIIGNKVVGSCFLDLFGGTGSVGIEAYSRGAEKVVFVDSSIKSIKLLKTNLQHLKIIDEVEIYNTDYNTAVKKLGDNGRSFDIIFVDPPYNKGIAQNSLHLIDAADILHKDGIIVVEHEANEVMPEATGRIVKVKEKKYGSTKLSVYNVKLEADNSIESSI